MEGEYNKIIEISGICKSFPGVKALRNVSFDIGPGEVHALCGENGAGKSTLIKVLTGAHRKDEGQMFVDGREIELSSTQDAIDLGIACIYQELSIVPQLDVAKNLFLGNLFVKDGIPFLDKKRLYNNAEEILTKYINLNISPRAIAGRLSVAQQQMIEIGRALTRNARVIIMDEPTSSLSDNEAETLFGLIDMLSKDGVSIIYISHKLDEVMRISDRITILRDGENIITVDKKDITKEQLISHMIGRDLDDMYNKKRAEHGETVLEVNNLSRSGVFEDISFKLKKGEILGFFGLVGAGRTEIMRAIFGVDKYDRGEVRVDGKKLKAFSPSRAIKSGLAFATENRKMEGLMLRLSVLVNITLVKLNKLSRFGVINRRSQKEQAAKYIQSISIKTPSLRQLAVNLSGGNQQKVVIAKWLMTEPKVLIVDEPTRGIDVGSKAEIYGLLCDLAQQGVAIVVVSSELEEIIGISDSVITIAGGRITAKMDVDGLSREDVLTSAFGGAARNYE